MTIMADKNWYLVLQLSPDATVDEIAAAVQKRSRQAAALANTAPERSQQLREQTRAIKRDLLSGEAARAAYDARLASDSQATQKAPALADPTYGASAQPEQQAAAYDYRQQHYQQQDPAAYGASQPRRQGRFMRFLQSGWTCWHCGESAMPGDQYCTQCQAQLVQTVSYTPVTTPVQNPHACAYCGTVASTIHRFCRTCGAGRY